MQSLLAARRTAAEASWRTFHSRYHGSHVLGLVVFVLVMSIDSWWSETGALTFPLLAATVGLGIWFATLRWSIRSWLCPRCELPFFHKSGWHVLEPRMPLHMVRHCMHCKLPKYETPRTFVGAFGALPSRRKRRKR